MSGLCGRRRVELTAASMVLAVEACVGVQEVASAVPLTRTGADVALT
jgi:hypothetical protein